MSVTPFVPAASPAPTAKAGPAGRSGRAGTPGSDETDAPTDGLDAFLATLSTAMAAIAQPVAIPADATATPPPSGATESFSVLAAATPRELPGSGGSTSLAAALPGIFAADTGSAATLATQPAGSSPLAGQLTPGGDPSTVGTGQSVDSSPLPATTAPGGDPSTVDSRQSVDSAPLPEDTGLTGTAGATTGATTPGVTPLTAGTQPQPQAPTPGAGKTTAVLRQVFPEVTRAVAHAGPGTHRLSITLSPDSLGEVKVTLVIRAGAVHVHLAPESGDAHQALLQGAPELHRLLEAASGEARVVVRDGANTDTQSSTDGRQPTPQQAAGEGSDSDRSPDRRNQGDGVAGPADESRGQRPTATRGTRPTADPGRLDRLM